MSAEEVEPDHGHEPWDPGPGGGGGGCDGCVTIDHSNNYENPYRNENLIGTSTTVIQILDAVGVSNTWHVPTSLAGNAVLQDEDTNYRSGVYRSRVKVDKISGDGEITHPDLPGTSYGGTVLPEESPIDWEDHLIWLGDQALTALWNLVGIPYPIGDLLESYIDLGSSSGSPNSHELTWYWFEHEDMDDDIASDGAKIGGHWSEYYLQMAPGNEMTVQYEDHTLYENFSGEHNISWLTIEAPPFEPDGSIRNGSLSQRVAKEYNLQQHSLDTFLDDYPLPPNTVNQLQSKKSDTVITASPNVTIHKS